MKILRVLSPSLVFLILSALQPAPAIAGDCLTAGCHQELGTKKFPHQPTADEECLACHEQELPQHPAPGAKNFALAMSVPELCYQCHDEQGQGTRAHPPVAAGDCLDCHDPHGSDNEHLLKLAMPKLCYQCHDTIRDEARARVRHAALYREGSCGICHSGHGTGRPHLLVEGEKDLCLSCHGQDDFTRSDALRNIGREIKGQPYSHGPVADGECSPCHAPHGSDFPRLLRDDYPRGNYVPYTPGTYSLCFDCHDSAILQSRKTTTDTNFRDGNRNLHFLHAADSRKARVCTTCHASHASSNPKMINEKGISFGAWEIPINYRTTTSGGSCAPGCHKAVSYKR